MRSIAVANWKGGSGKTTTALCLAVGMARRGRRVLLVDADSQGNASMTMLDGAPAEPPTLGDVLLGQRRRRRGDPADEGRGARSILPADRSLADAALLLADKVGREHRLRRRPGRARRPVRRAIVDCPPQLSLARSTSWPAVGEVIVPVDAGIYSVAGLASCSRPSPTSASTSATPALRVAGLVHHPDPRQPGDPRHRRPAPGRLWAAGLWPRRSRTRSGSRKRTAAT